MIQSKQRSVRPYYIMVEGCEVDLADAVKALLKKLKATTITPKEIKLIGDLNTALDKYKKSRK